MTFFQAASPLLRKLESIIHLTEDELRAVQGLPVQLVNIAANQDIVRQGDRPSRSFFVQEGIICTYKTTGRGKRQISAFHIAGDAPDVQSLHLKVLDISIATLTPCRLGFVRHESLRELCVRHSRVADALWRQTLIDGSIYREWLINVGQRNAYTRIAHLICEMIVRHHAVGLSTLVDGKLSIGWSVTQTQIGDALGLSVVHINRSIQALRNENLVYMKGGTLIALNWDGLQQAGDFDAEYLHIDDERLPMPLSVALG